MSLQERFDLAYDHFRSRPTANAKVYVTGGGDVNVYQWLRIVAGRYELFPEALAEYVRTIQEESNYSIGE